MLINLTIPGWHNNDELKKAYDEVITLPNNSTIVELGPCYGLVTYVLAMNAPTSSVYAIDMWIEDEVIKKGHGYRLDTVDTIYNSIENFKKYMKDVPNAYPIRGDAFEVSFDKTIDLLVIDCDRGPNKTPWKQHILHWLPKVRKGGKIIGFHGWPHRQDVHDQVDDARATFHHSFEKDSNTGFWSITVQ